MITDKKIFNEPTLGGPRRLSRGITFETIDGHRQSRSEVLDLSRGSNASFGAELSIARSKTLATAMRCGRSQRLTIQF